VSLEVVDLIHRMSLANPGWGAPRIRGEPLKLGFELSQAPVAKYLVHKNRLHVRRRWGGSTKFAAEVCFLVVNTSTQVWL
jgi:hypothetical protein